MNHRIQIRNHVRRLDDEIHLRVAREYCEKTEMYFSEAKESSNKQMSTTTNIEIANQKRNIIPEHSIINENSSFI